MDIDAEFEQVVFHVWVRIEKEGKSVHYRLHYVSSPWFEVDDVRGELARHGFTDEYKFKIIRAIVWYKDGSYFPIKINTKGKTYTIKTEKMFLDKFGT